MKKNRTMRIAAVMLVFALLTTCIISGSFAKYTTGGTTTDEARVAKFGATVTATSNTLFANSYATDDGAYSASITNSIVATSGKVLAPGSEGTLTAFTIGGTPSEVAVEVSYTIKTLDLDGWVDGTAFYCPLIFKIGTQSVNGLSYDNADAFKAAIQTKLDAFKHGYLPGATIGNTEGLTIGWEWPFETGADAANDPKDTALGRAGTATIKVEFTATVTQID